jgi:hypothetical protein
MKKIEWIREGVSAWSSSEHLRGMQDSGWRLIALEWEREIDVEPRPQTELHATEAADEIPYGLRVAADCRHLEENPSEMEVLNYLAEMIVTDVSYTHMADALNQRSFRTRAGHLWTAVAVFKLTPRLIDVAPRILSGAEWETRKKKLTRVAWNS